MNYYETLGIAPDATQEEIRKAYKALSQKYHPDKNKGNDSKFKEIKQAYDFLKDEIRRELYDCVGNDVNIKIIQQAQGILRVLFLKSIQKDNRFASTNGATFYWKNHRNSKEFISDNLRDLNEETSRRVLEIKSLINKFERKKNKLLKSNGGQSLFDKILDEEISKGKAELAACNERTEVVKIAFKILDQYLEESEASDEEKQQPKSLLNNWRSICPSKFNP